MTDADLSAMSLTELLDRGARDEISGNEIDSNPAAISDEGQREVAAALLTEPRFAPPNAFGDSARSKVVHRCVARRDPAILEILRRIADTPEHPLQGDALAELLVSREREIIEPLFPRVLATLDAVNVDPYRHRLAADAVCRMGIDAVLAELVPRYLTPEKVMRDRNSMQYAGTLTRAIAAHVGSKRLDGKHAGLAAAVVAISNLAPVRNATAELLRHMDREVVSHARTEAAKAASVAPAKPAAKRAKAAPKKKAPKPL